MLRSRLAKQPLHSIRAHRVHLRLRPRIIVDFGHIVSVGAHGSMLKSISSAAPEEASAAPAEPRGALPTLSRNQSPTPGCPSQASNTPIQTLHALWCTQCPISFEQCFTSRQAAGRQLISTVPEHRSRRHVQAKAGAGLGPLHPLHCNKIQKTINAKQRA